MPGADQLTERLGDIVANAVTLVVANHHVLVAEGLGMLLDAEDDLVVLDPAHHTGRAVESAAEHRPAVLVLDADLPTGDLAETLAAAKAASPTTKLLVLSGAAHPETTGGAHLWRRQLSGQGPVEPSGSDRHPPARRR